MNEIQAFDKLETKSLDERRALILAFEEHLAKLDGAVVELPTRHFFSEGAYTREMSMPKGMVIVGKIHKYRTTNILAKGEVSVFCPVQGKIRIKAPHIFVSEPGAKRVIYAHEDSVFINVHGTTETDIEKIEDHFIAPSFGDVPQIYTEIKKELL